MSDPPDVTASHRQRRNALLSKVILKAGAFDAHNVGTIQTAAPAFTIGPDTGAASSGPNTWSGSFASVPAPTGTKFLILHFTAVSLPASNRLEVDLGYDTDVFTSADGTDFWTRPVNIYALAGGLVPVRYITNGSATGIATLDVYGRGERMPGIQDPGALSNCDPFLTRSPPIQSRNTTRSGTAPTRRNGRTRPAPPVTCGRLCLLVSG